MYTALMLRPGTLRPEGIGHACIESFEDIHLEA